MKIDIAGILKRGAATALAVVTAFGAAGCGTSRQPGISAQKLVAGEGQNLSATEPVADIDGAEIDKEFIEGAASFAAELFKNSADGKENSMVSPLSVLLALSMTANGAKGNTLAQMEEVLCKGMSIDRLNAYCRTYAKSLPDTPKAKLSIADSVWVRNGFEVKDEFLGTVGAYYDADVYRAPFDGQTVRDINCWVSDKTDGMIDEVIDKISGDTVMYLINAIAFDAEWEKIYENTEVRDAVFTTGGGEEKKVSMMYSTEDYYVEDDKASGFVKNYRDGYAFVGLLPKEGVTLDEYIASLDGPAFIKMLDDKKTGTVYAGLPKFESEYSLTMNDALRAMGMTDAFAMGTADFSGICGNPDDRIFINSVIHKTYINVDERGTKAGAVTVVEMKEGSAMMPSFAYEVYLDRPFVYAIVDTGTNLPVFIGAVRDIGEK